MALTGSIDSVQLAVGDQFPTRLLAQQPTVSGVQAWPPPPGRLTHIQLRRFAGCPVCNLHLRLISGRMADIETANVHEVVVFHSSRDELDQYQDMLPFSTVADPNRVLYRAIGVEPSIRAVLNPRFWLRVPSVIGQAVRALRGKGLPGKPGGGQLGRPADFLLDEAGRVIALHYGVHAGDQWSVEQLLALVGSTTQLPGNAS